MLHVRPSRIHHAPEEAVKTAEKVAVAVVPLGIPLIAGPVAISTVIIYAQQAVTWFDTILLLLTTVFVVVAV